LLLTAIIIKGGCHENNVEIDRFDINGKEVHRIIPVIANMNTLVNARSMFAGDDLG
jgi:hypothetical protein